MRCLVLFIRAIDCVCDVYVYPVSCKLVRDCRSLVRSLVFSLSFSVSLYPPVSTGWLMVYMHCATVWVPRVVVLCAPQRFCACIRDTVPGIVRIRLSHTCAGLLRCSFSRMTFIVVHQLYTYINHISINKSKNAQKHYTALNDLECATWLWYRAIFFAYLNIAEY